MLNIFVPISFISATVRPDHFALSVTLIIFVLPDVFCSALPHKMSLAMASVLHVGAFIRIALGCAVTAPATLTMLLTIHELSDIHCTTFPSVGSLSVGFSIFVLAAVCVSGRGKLVRALAVLETHLPFAFVDISIPPSVHTVPVGFRLKPLTDVRIFLSACPDSLALLHSIMPRTIINFTVGPSINPKT